MASAATSPASKTVIEKVKKKPKAANSKMEWLDDLDLIVDLQDAKEKRLAVLKAEMKEIRSLNRKITDQIRWLIRNKKPIEEMDGEGGD